MLEKKKITMEAKTIVNEVEVCTFMGILDQTTGKWSFFNRVHDKDLYKEHREIVRADQANFEDSAYYLQEMLEKLPNN